MRKEWNRQRRIMPDITPPKTYICKVCGSKIIPRSINRYIATERVVTGGIANVMNGSSAEPKLFDCFDCGVCGCQFVAKERLRNVDEHTGHVNSNEKIS